MPSDTINLVDSRKTRPIREKPHRLPAEDYRGDVTISATVCVVGRRPLLSDEEVVATFVSKLRSLSERWNCWIPIYCFMPDHLHLIVKGNPVGGDAKALLDGFKTSAGIWLSRRRPGFRLQKDYHDHVMRVGEDWRNHAFYVLNNPVRAGLISD